MAFMVMCHILLTGCSIGFVFVSKALVDTAVAILGGSSVELGLLFWALCMCGIILVRIFLNAIRSYLQTSAEVGVTNRLRIRLFDSLLHLKH